MKGCMKLMIRERTLNILMIGAHPDDCELQTGGIACKYRSLGHQVKFVSATTGETGHFEQGGVALARRRAEEARQAASRIGAAAFVMDVPSNQLIASLDNRAKFIALIRDYKPDIIFTHRPNDYHPDHRVTSQLVQDSSYAVLVPGVLPLIAPLQAKPVIVYMYDSFTKPVPIRPDIVIDIDDVSRQKLQMIHCHTSQMYEWLPWMEGELDQVPLDEEARLAWLARKMERRDGAVANRFRDRLIQKYGDDRGKTIKCAEAFEISEYGALPPTSAYDYYFPV